MGTGKNYCFNKNKTLQAGHLLRLGIFCLALLPLFLGAQATMGLLRYEAGSFNGYTLFGNNETTYLIDNCGYVVNQWQSAYKTGHGMYLLDNGDLLRAGSLTGTFDAGGIGGIFELFDWNGQIKWQYKLAEPNLHAHHDMALLPNGNFLVCAWERHSEQEAKAMGRQYGGEVWSERILELQRSGSQQATVVWQWRAWDHLIQDVDPNKPNYGSVAEHPEKININYIGEGQPTSSNWLHFNAIDYHPGLDQIVVSSRLLSEIWVIDHSTTTTEAAGNAGGQSGKGGDLLYRYGNPQAYERGSNHDQQLNGQHDIKWIPEGLPYAGHFMVFNNLYMPETASRVEIFAPPLLEDGTYQIDDNAAFGPSEPVWTYSGNGLYSDILSNAQLFPNGNLLICEGRNGYFFEVDSLGKLVWEYINPVNRNGGPGIQGGQPRFNMTFRATRYATDHPAFVGKDLTPGLPVELSPLDYDCELLPSNTTDVGEGAIEWKGFKILGNPFHEHLRLEVPFEQKMTIRIFTLSGQLAHTSQIAPGIQEIDLSDQSNGAYFLQLQTSDRRYHQLVIKH